MSSMRAAVVRHPGGPDALHLEEMPRPEARSGWVCIHVKGFGLSRSELYARRGDYPEVEFPRVLGTECVGLLEEAGPETALHPGQTAAAVMGGMGRLFDGCYAEYVLAPATHVMPIVTALPWDMLAALPKSYLTALGALNTLDLVAGQTFLICGATSSVGMAALTLAKEAGATVIATTRNPAKTEALRAAGADQVLIDSGTLEPEVQRVAPGGVHALLEMIGAETLRDSLHSLAPKGTLCYMGFLGEVGSIDEFRLLDDIPSSVRLTVYASRPTINAANCTQALQHIVENVASGRYPAHLDRVFPFEEIVAAHRCMDESRATGKIVVLVP
jgi:NADPH:quinone reductase